MNEIKALEAMGLTLPSPLYILGSGLFGIMGCVAFRHGRKSARTEMTIAGVVLMLYPYIVPETWMLWAVGVALTGWVFAKWHPLLGKRLLECVQLLPDQRNSDAHDIFGSPDDLKFRSCLTLFAQVAKGEPAFDAALKRFFGGKPDESTLKLLKGS